MASECKCDGYTPCVKCDEPWENKVFKFPKSLKEVKKAKKEAERKAKKTKKEAEKAKKKAEKEAEKAKKKAEKAKKKAEKEAEKAKKKAEKEAEQRAEKVKKEEEQAFIKETQMEIEGEVDYSYWVKNLGDSSGLKTHLYEYFKYFTKVGDYVLDKNEKTKNMLSVRVDTEKEKVYEERRNLVYLIVKDDEIVKVGGTKTGMKARIASYSCGYYIKERKNSEGKNYPGKMSGTNAYLYHTIYHYTKKGSKFSLYVYPIEDKFVEVEIFGVKKIIKTQIYEEWEKQCLDKYKETYGKLPILCDNSHP